MEVRSRDTTADAHAVQIAVLCRLGPSRRLELGLRLADEARQMSMESIRRRHPGYSDAEVRFACFRLYLNDDALFRAAWPEAPLLAP